MTQLELLEACSLPVLAEANTTPPSGHPPGRTNSQMSIIATSSSSVFCFPPKTKEYMDSLVPPTADGFERIASVQQEREEELRRKARELKRQSLKSQGQHERNGSSSSDGRNERTQAARVIQRTFRGHRARREMNGFGLDAGTRWMTAIREAQFREVNRPKSKDDTDMSNMGAGSPEGRQHSMAREKWKKASMVARRANHDDDSSDSSSQSSDEEASPEDRAAAKAQRHKANSTRRSEAKMMGIQYFLEMVDLKHRYGSNLRTYHEEWKRSPTKENFFYWLDYGEGRNIELESCPRDRLDRERVRYLSREERQYYLVEVDNEGRLRWAKNGKRIDTTVEYKDSIHGVVPSDDPTPAFNPVVESGQPRGSVDTTSSDSSLESIREADRAAKYATPGFDDSGSFKKVSHLSASTIFNRLLRKSVKKNTWIFVADTSFRLYVGIKNSGAFQHSSFLQGSRISAAGLIKIKNGRLRSLSPLSGHYRPPAANFRAFVRNLKDGGVDTSHVAISKSYAVLVGLEAYLRTRHKGKEMLGKLAHGKDKILEPEEVARREEDARDKSKSAEKERKVLEREQAEREAEGTRVKMMQKLRISSSRLENDA
ncbi:hypothetical protein G7Z17_g6587 [Cylindrodendrum hubeiense]|uniref:Uncharacterized protein n=1 Tax=Cylindrodendrum hubeiense TaxID=595255 RepID=A0A9P5H542_9HYPO|nr:hypothetical protein G7Z17_g6587 [Cylindrodendrum hubeiense]